jgi:restriction system protein
MSRKSLLEAYAEPFADLPPLAGVITAALLALAGWIMPNFAGQSVIAAAWLLIGRWLVWLLAALVLAFTIKGAVSRFGDRRRFDSTDDPGSLKWAQFERFVAEYYRRSGATVTPRGGPMADGGVDLVLDYATGERLIVQCKHWKSRLVGVKPLRELWGVRDDEKADGAIFITSGAFTADAATFAHGKHLELIDGGKLRAMIADVKRTGAAAAAANGGGSSAAPACPRCGSPMVLRTARRGAHAGDAFWGCSTYPRCRETLPH